MVGVEDFRADAAGAALLPELAIGVLHRLDAGLHIEHRLDIVVRQQQHQAGFPSCAGADASQSATKLGHVAAALDGAACRHELRRRAPVRARRHEIERLGLDLGARHRIVRRAPHRNRAMRQPASVPQCDLHDGLAPRPRLHQLLAGNELDLLPHGENGLIAHALVIVHRLERQAAIDQQHRHEMLHVDVRHRRIVDRARRAGRQMDPDRCDLAERGLFALHQAGQRIERRLRRRADRPFLDVRGQDLEALAERFGEL